MTEGVTEYLDYYLDTGHESDFAIMLNGPWGAGKTHFIKAYFKERESKKKSKAPPAYLYASFNGVRSTPEITDQFFAQTHPALNSKAGRFVGTVASRVVNVLLASDANSSAENSELIKSLMLGFKGRALVFDDLERSGMPLSEAMGFINAFVEHEKLKVIVIANEDDIDDDEKQEYARKKEKLIGKTLRATSAPDAVLSSFIDNLANAKVKEVAKHESAALLSTFNASGKLNFRSMRSVLWDYDRLVSSVDPRLRDKPEAMKRLLLLMMALGLEFRSGDLSSDDLRAFPVSGLARALVAAAKREKSPATIRLEELETKYPDVVWSDPIVPLGLLASLFETGVIDPEIDRHLSSHPSIVGYAHTPIWRQLWSWDDLPRDQYLKARGGLISQLEKRELMHPGLILHAAGVVIGLREFGDVLLPNAEGVVPYFGRYVLDLQSGGKLEPVRGLFGRSGGTGYGGYGFMANDSTDFKEVEKLVDEATKNAFADRMKNIAGSYLQRLSANEDDYASLHQYDVEKGNYAEAPFLHHIDTAAFAQFIVRDTKPDSRLLACLQARYEFEKQHRALTQEYPWLKQLRSRLENIASALPPPHKRLLESRVAYVFDKIEDTIAP